MARKKQNRKGNRKRKQAGPRMLSLGPTYPNSLIAKHKMVYSFDLTQSYAINSIGSTNLQSFNINSMYDPDTSALPSSGHQPRFYDEMAAIYNTYRVIGAKVRIRFVNLCGEPVYCYALLGNQQLSAATGWVNSTLKEVKGMRSSLVHSVNCGEKSVRTITMGYSPERIEGKSKAVIRGDPNFEALSGSNPNEIHLLSVAMSQVADGLGAASNALVRCEITIDFSAIWNDRKIHLTGS
jgi:hypothetical protein